MNKQAVKGLNQALAAAAMHLEHLPEINRVTLRKKGAQQAQPSGNQKLTRAQQISKILYDSPDMQNNS